MKGMWKKLLAIVCVTALLFTCPGIAVYGEEMNAETYIGGTDDEEVSAVPQESSAVYTDKAAEGLQPAGISEPAAPDSIEPEQTAEELQPADISESAAPDSIESEQEAEERQRSGEADASGTSDELTAEEESSEEMVGTMVVALENYSLGSNVTANAYGEYGLGYPLSVTLILTFKNGTLPGNWKEKLDQADWKISGDWREFVHGIEVEIASGKGYLPANSSGLFSGLSSVTYIDLEGIDTSKVTNMASMFYNCESLEHVTFGSVNTANVQDMKGMFSRCYSLTDVDLDSFNTSNVKDMSSMFYKCGSLENLNVYSFDTKKVTKMVSMFYECGSLKELNVAGFVTSNVTDMTYMFARCYELEQLYFGDFNTSKVTSMGAMFQMCEKLKYISTLYFDTSNVKNFLNMFSYCSALEELYLKNFDTSNATEMSGMFNNCSSLKKLDLSSFDTSAVEDTDMKNDGFITGCSGLVELRTPKVNTLDAGLPKTMYDGDGKSYSLLPKLTKSIVLRNKPFKDISKAVVSGISLSYGYTASSIQPAFTVTYNGKVLTPDVDYTYFFYDNLYPGTARLEIEGIGNYGGIKVKTFEIVDCVSSITDGGTYQLIPKNNSETAVCAYSGKMVNNTKVYITDRSASEAMRFVAKKNSDGSWKFINAKCELALAIQQNSKEVGKGLVLYEQTTKPMQNWKLEKKSDNSFAIKSAVTGLSIAMSDASAAKGTTLSMQTSASSGLQRFYFAAADPVKTPYKGTYAIRASKDKTYAVNINGASVKEGANVNLYKFSNLPEQKFTALYSGGGYYRFVNLKSGMVITAVSPNAESNVVQKKWGGLNEQRWKFTKQSDGTYKLVNAGGYVLHLSGNSATNGTNIVAKKPASTGAQKWFMTKVK